MGRKQRGGALVEYTIFLTYTDDIEDGYPTSMYSTFQADESLANFNEALFNRAIDSLRSPGSAIQNAIKFDSYNSEFRSIHLSTIPPGEPIPLNAVFVSQATDPAFATAPAPALAAPAALEDPALEEAIQESIMTQQPLYVPTTVEEEEEGEDPTEENNGNPKPHTGGVRRRVKRTHSKRGTKKKLNKRKRKTIRGRR